MCKPKKTKLLLRYDKRQKDFLVFYPRRCDGALAMHHLINDMLEWRMPNNNYEYPNNREVTNFVKELERRGYDPKTIRFSIELKE